MLKVMVVDDDPDICKLLKAKLEATKQYTVLIADDGWEALRVAEKEKPDVVLCDIDMPDMDGVSVAHAMEKKDATKSIPFVFLSSLVTPKDVSRGVRAEKWAMLSKQSPMPDLIKGIEDAVGRKNRQ